MPETIASGLKALLFDVDGTLCDSAKLHYRAWTKVLAGRMREIPTWDDFVRESLRKQRQFEELLDVDTLQGEGRDRLYEAKTQELQRLLDVEIHPLPGVLDLWNSVRDLGGGIAIVSTARLASVRSILARLRLPKPDVIVTREDVARRVKPDPAGYLIALECLGCAAAEAVAFEDDPAGIRAARAAGLVCCAVASQIFQRGEQSEADFMVNTLADVRVARDAVGFKLKKRLSNAMC